MRKSLMALLLASAACAPAFAAPDRADGQELLAEAREVSEAIAAEPQSEPAAAYAAQSEQREAVRRTPRIERVEPNVEVAPVLMAQREQGENEGGGWRGRGRDGGGGDRGGNGGMREQQSAPIPTAEPSRDRQRGDNAGWQRRDSGGPQQQQTAPDRQPPRGDQQADRDANRGGDWRGRNWDDQRQPRADRPQTAFPSPQPNRPWDRDRDRDRREGGFDNDGGRNREWGNRGWGDRDARRDQGNGRWSRDQAYDDRLSRDRYDNDRFGRDNRSSWNRNWRGDNRYNWQSHRNDYPGIYRTYRYYNPYGYDNPYQRFGIGIYLNSGFYGRSYWISDPWSYRLPSAPFGYRWVRYYNDVLLVNTRDGYVVDVIYSFFR
jgi:Nickel/cobalt transporter regulator